MKAPRAHCFSFLALLLAIAWVCSCQDETSPSIGEGKAPNLAPKNLLCTAKLGKEVFLLGEPLEVGARLKNISNRTLEFPNCRPLIIENFIVISDSGRRLPYVKKRPEWVEKVLSSEPRSLRPGVDRGAGRVDIADAYDIRTPGTYTIRVRWPLNISATEFVVSDNVIVRVLPKGSLAARIRMVGETTAVLKGTTLEAELTFINNLPASEHLRNVSVWLLASGKNSGVSLSGIPAQRAGKENWMGTCYTGENKVTYDFASALWNRMVSSVGPIRSIWDFIDSDDTLTFTIQIAGLLNGKRFKVYSNAAEVQIIVPKEQRSQN